MSVQKETEQAEVQTPKQVSEQTTEKMPEQLPVDRTPAMLKNIVIILGVLIFIAAGLLIFGVVRQMSKGNLAPHIHKEGEGDIAKSDSVPLSSVPHMISATVSRSFGHKEEFAIAIPQGEHIQKITPISSLPYHLMIFSGSHGYTKHVFIFSYQTGKIVRRITFK